MQASHFRHNIPCQNSVRRANDILIIAVTLANTISPLLRFTRRFSAEVVNIGAMNTKENVGQSL